MIPDERADMGAAARYAEKHGLIACSRCQRPFDERRRLACIAFTSDLPLDAIGEAVCRWCDLKEAGERYERQRYERRRRERRGCEQKEDKK